MPHPKHRFSQTRTAKRRTHDSLISHRKECRVVKSSLRFEVDSKGALL